MGKRYRDGRGNTFFVATEVTLSGKRNYRIRRNAPGGKWCSRPYASSTSCARELDKRAAKNGWEEVHDAE